MNIFLLNIFFYGVAAMMGLSILIAVAYPWMVVCFREGLPDDFVMDAKRRLFMSFLVAFVFLCQVFGVSLAYHGVNTLVVVSAVFCGFLLVVFSFNLDIKLYGIPVVGPLSALAWLLIAFALLIGLAEKDGNLRTVEIGHGMYCHQYDWGGGFGNAGGNTVDVFKRYLIIDKLVASEAEAYDQPEALRLSPAKNEAISLCRAAFLSAIKHGRAEKRSAFRRMD